MGKRTLYIHIGMPKTATTALQHFFALNRETLKKKGVIYPLNINGEDAQHRLGWSFKTARGKSRWWFDKDLKPFQEEWDFVLRQLNNGKNLISTEDLWGLKENEIICIKKLVTDFSAKIVAYLRRQDNLDNSWYNELIKIGLIECTPEENNKSIQLKQFDPWVNVFKKENITVRPYEKQQFYGGSIFSDFLHHVLGMELTNEFTLPQGDLNIRLHRIALEYKRLVNLLPLTPREKIKTLNPLFKVSHIFTEQGRKDYPALSPQRRMEIIQKRNERYSQIAREFLGRKDGKLFYDPPPDSDEDWQDYDELPEGDAQAINSYLAENHPDGLRIITQGILQAQYSDNGKIRQAALKLLPGISPSHLIGTLTCNLKSPKTKYLSSIPQSQLEEIYSSKTWKTGMVLNRVYNKMPGIIKKPMLKAAQGLYHLANRP